MDIKEIQELIKFVAKSGATEVNLEIDNVKISIKSPAKKGAVPETTIIQQIPVAQTPAAVIPTATPASAPAATTTKPSEDAPIKAETNDDDKYITIKSPMIGTFYRSPNPESGPFISEGDIIKPGQTICIVEAMKLFNEIESEVSGKVVKVIANDSSPIEFDQPLFEVDPS